MILPASDFAGFQDRENLNFTHLANADAGKKNK
jgi:hypothetical protein